jgi:hypothetical protein
MPARFKPNMGNLPPEMICKGERITNAFSRAINLTKNSQFYVRHGDVERLIAQGFLQRLS